MKKLFKQDAKDIIVGAAALSSGGDCGIEQNFKIIDELYKEVDYILLADTSEIKDDALVCTPYICGFEKYLTKEEQEEHDKYYKKELSAPVQATRVLERHLNVEFDGFVPVEISNVNIAAVFEVAAIMKKPIIDADPTGRAAPCVQHTSYFLNNVPILPVGLANSFGEEMVLEKADDDFRVESTVRAMAVSSFANVGVADHPRQWKEVKDILIKSTMSLCLDVGQIIRNSKSNYAYEVIDKHKGYIAFEGTISEVNFEHQDGFGIGDIYIDGIGDFKGDVLKIWYHNENIISWKNNEVFVTIPDNINLVDVETNQPILNPTAKVGMKVTVFVLKSYDLWRTEKGLEVFGPKFFGYDIEYNKVENLLENK